MNELLELNGTWLRNRLAVLGLKQWWVAEQVGVDRRTVMRWVNGQVRGIRADNARALAAVLGCAVDELLVGRDVPALASAEDQRVAGLALARAGLLERLGPVHQWDVAESLLKASAVRDLPLDVLGSLYHQLAVACWRQDKLGEAARHNDAALGIAARTGDHALRARALGSRATLRQLRGEIGAAIADWHDALALGGYLEARERANLHSNLGATLYETGHLAAGHAEIMTALELLQDGGTAMQACIARSHLALLALDGDRIADAAREAQCAQALARQADYRRGLALTRLLLAETHAAAGDGATAAQLVDQGLAAFAELRIAEAPTQRLAGRVWRRLGHLEEALAALRTGLPLAAEFPLERADLHGEIARVAALQGDVGTARTEAEHAARLYRACAAAPKIAMLAHAMSPHVTWQPGEAALT